MFRRRKSNCAFHLSSDRITRLVWDFAKFLLAARQKKTATLEINTSRSTSEIGLNAAISLCLKIIHHSPLFCLRRRCPQCCSLASNLASSAQAAGGNLTHSLSSAHLSLSLSAVSSIDHTHTPYIFLTTTLHIHTFIYIHTYMPLY